MKKMFTSVLTSIEERKVYVYAYVAIPLLYFLVMGMSVSGSIFRSDDFQQLQYVGEAKSFWSLFQADVFGLMRPVKNLLFFLFSEVAPFGIKWCHVIGLVIGALSFFPVLALCQRILDSNNKGMLAASVWLFAPTLVSSAAWLSCVNILVMTSFASASIALHDSAWDGNHFRVSRIAMATACLFVSLFSYECAIATVPLIVLFDIFLRPQRIHSRRTLSAYLTYATVVLVFLILRHIDGSVISTTGCFYGTTRIQRIVSSPYFVVQHFLWWVWPFGRLCVAGAYTWGMVPIWKLALCWFALFVVVVLCLSNIKQHSVLKFCLLFFLVGFAPTSNCLGFGNGPYGDYYMGLASIGLSVGFIAILFGLFADSKYRTIFRMSAVCLAISRIATIGVTIDWAKTWSSEDLLIPKNAACNPSFYSAKIILAMRLSDQKRFEEDLDICRQIENLVGSDSIHMASVYTLRAISEIEKKSNPEMAFHWIDESYRVAERLKFSKGIRHFWRGKVYEEMLGDTLNAEREYELSLSSPVPSIAAMNKLALLNDRNGNHEKALELWKQVVRIIPNNETALWHLSMALRKDGDEQEADRYERWAERIGER